ncbi:hypothetical protein [Azonexus sp.]|uniref:hypothetical protein n=1 Tax=Azonexus sp. TaxID=1872668 RepID=UPI0035B0156C
MEQSSTFEAAKAELTELLDESLKAATAKRHTAVSTPGIENHGAFTDIEEAERLLSMGCNALKGIGAMLLPGTNAADETTSARRLELSEIFSFFGEVMAERSQLISDAVFRIEQAAGGRPG